MKYDFDHCEDEISTTEISILLKNSSYKIDLILYYSEEYKAYQLFVAYDKMFKKVMTQRKKPRTFKLLDRCVEWGKKQGFKTIRVHLDYDKYEVEEN